MNFAKALKLARISKGFSQEELAQKTGIARTNLSAYENNKTSPGLDSLIKVSKALGMKVSELMACGEDKKNIKKKSFPRISNYNFNKNSGLEVSFFENNDQNINSNIDMIKLFNQGKIDHLPKKKLKFPVSDSAYLFKVVTDHMSPRINNDDIIWVESMNSQVKSNDIVLVQLKNFYKDPILQNIYLEKDGSYIFTSDNRRYLPIRCKPEEVKLIHTWLFTIPKNNTKRFIYT